MSDAANLARVNHGDDIEEQLQGLQGLIDTGTVWKLEGSMGRAAMDAIEAGHCMLGPKPHRDYWGNIVPAWWMVEPGTKGSPEHANYEPGAFERPPLFERTEALRSVGLA